ncbi:hypothetical protein MPSEU_000597200 [Mayamaea pseudoterrestris]|nr:hypothetical protein MPSEU_000597200 [Mayamaea pseudoterrestris]
MTEVNHASNKRPGQDLEEEDESWMNVVVNNHHAAAAAAASSSSPSSPMDLSHHEHSTPPRKRLFVDANIKQERADDDGREEEVKDEEEEAMADLLEIKQEDAEHDDDDYCSYIPPALSSVTLTKEQLSILASCPPPTAATRPRRKAQLFRITAAAGSGKTTTLLHLAVQAYRKGHTHITYLTFGKAAAAEGRNRILQTLAEQGLLQNNVTINARTLHSAAHMLIANDLKNESDEALVQWDEKRLKRYISEVCASDIDNFIDRGCRAFIMKTYPVAQHKEALNRARNQVETFIFKSLQHFCQSAWSLPEYLTGVSALTGQEIFGRDYYPAALFHAGSKCKNDEERRHMIFPIHIYANMVDFYAQQAHKLFVTAMEQKLFTFDLCMKQAQLSQFQIPGSIILLDESQDLDGCQVDWVARIQVQRHGTHVYVVGDAAQTIYGFRGAKSQNLMNLNVDRNLSLLGSFRFGKAIANIAQCILFAKEVSDQTSQICDRSASYDKRYRDKVWLPYQIHSAIDRECFAITESLIPRWRDKKFTLIGRRNSSLVSAILTAFTRRTLKDEDDPEGPADFFFDAGSIPKIHVAGGSNSGAKLFSSVFKSIHCLMDLYQGKVSSLPDKDFPEFAGSKNLTWASFCEDAHAREINKYIFPVDLIELYQENTMEAVDFFKSQILDKRITAEDADIILTTCHTAKGLEWDNVQLCDDFISLDKEAKQDSRKLHVLNGYRWDTVNTYGKWLFDLGIFPDDINLLYVACTRAKHILSVPPRLVTFLDKLDDMFRERRHGIRDAQLFKSLVWPLRQRLGLSMDGNDLLKDFLLTSNYFGEAEAEFEDDADDGNGEEDYNGDEDEFDNDMNALPSLPIVTQSIPEEAIPMSL